MYWCRVTDRMYWCRVTDRMLLKPIPQNRTHFSIIINDVIIDMNKFEFLSDEMFEE
jgi:hypothetical protein